MKILVIGSGAREHALLWKLAQSPKTEDLYVAPGNAGTGAIAHNLNISPTDIEALAQSVEQYHIDLTVVGPEASLAEGIVNLFHHRGFNIFGPTREATKIESSKVFARELMGKYHIPCASGKVFSSLVPAREYVEQHSLPVVVKADGLAAGKGSIVAQTRGEALEALSDIMERRIFGSAGDKVIIEECLEGKEVSLLAFTDGETVIPMVPVCDYKRALDGDQGLNTGGMGSYSPPLFFGPVDIAEVQHTILEPTMRAMSQEGKPFKGILYAGLMLTSQGIRVLEFNARFGDPETQVILPRLKTDLVDILLAVVEEKLAEVKIEWSDNACVGVVLASEGYPGSYKTGFPIRGWDSLEPEVLAFHAGTKVNEAGEACTAGGRVLTVAGSGKTLAKARAKVYRNIPHLSFEGCHYRHDIAAV